MNWDAIGAIGEIIGASGVIISVAYLAVQIRTGSKALSTNLRDSIFASVGEWNHSLTADPEFAWMFHKGLQDFQSLEEKERPRFMHTAFSFFKVFENIYLHYLEGSIGEEAWIQHRTVVHAYFTMPGAQYYIEARRGAFDRRYLEELEKLGSPGIATPDDVGRESPNA